MSATAIRRPLLRRAHLTPSPGSVAAWLLGLLPCAYLALSGGGYDIVARSEVGVVIWWTVLLGLAVGALPRIHPSRTAWVALLLLTAFLGLTWAAAGWSPSEERTLAEAARVATYLGVFTAGVLVVHRRTVHALLGGLALAVTLVSALAVLSVLIPSLFPVDTAARFYATSRLRYPFDYSDGVGEFVAFGFPLLLFVATGARTIAGRALGAAGLPVVVLALTLTVSRGGIFAAVVGVLVYFAIAPDRLPRLATAMIAAVASALVLLELAHAPGVRNVFTVAPAGQRHSMLTVLILCCAGAGIAQGVLSVFVRRLARPNWLRVTRRGAVAISSLIATVVLIGAVILFASGEAHRLWQQFKQPNPPSGTTYFRLLSLAGSHRYQYWQAAIGAYHTHPWRGIGPGTFEFWWAQHNTLGEFVRNAHSLYFETLAELGIPGLALVIALCLVVLLGGGIARGRAPSAVQPAIAAAVAGFAAFCAAAGFDWVWQIGAIPLVALLLAAAALGRWDEPIRWGPDGRETPPGRLARLRAMATRPSVTLRIAVAVLGLVSLWAIVVPLAETIEVRASQAAVGRSNYRAALSDAATAQSLEPGAASPRLQRALILEQLGDIRGASQAVAAAIAREPVNWRNWLVASRIATEADRPRQALADYRRAKALNPTSPLFNG